MYRYFDISSYHLSAFVSSSHARSFCLFLSCSAVLYQQCSDCSKLRHYFCLDNCAFETVAAIYSVDDVRDGVSWRNDVTADHDAVVGDSDANSDLLGNCHQADCS